MNEKAELSPIMKLSEGKATLPGKKQVFRFKDKKGNFKKDIIALANEKIPASPLLKKVMEHGKVIFDYPSLNEVRAFASENLSKLPEEYQKLTKAPQYPVELSQALKGLVRKLKKELTKTEILGST
jgi:nicotinate phosphoribosyltransferase